MNRQQKLLLISISSMLVLVLAIMLVISLNQGKPDRQANLPNVATPSIQPTQQVSQEELGRQALSEEETEPSDTDEEADGTAAPID